MSAPFFQVHSVAPKVMPKAMRNDRKSDLLTLLCDLRTQAELGEEGCVSKSATRIEYDSLWMIQPPRDPLRIVI